LKQQHQQIEAFARVVSLAAALLAVVVGGCTEIRVRDERVTYVALGDSSTAGPSSRNYPDILIDLLDEPATSFANEGESNSTTARGIERIDEILEGDYYPNAEVWLYWLGGADITEFMLDVDPLLLVPPSAGDYPFDGSLQRRLDEIDGNLAEGVQRIQATGATVYMATLYLVREDVDECDPLPLNVIVAEQARVANEYIVHERIRDVAARTGAILVEIVAEDADIRSSEDNYFNCNHLSASGNEIVARVFFDTISATPGD
jgi:hypothetical protein